MVSGWLVAGAVSETLGAAAEGATVPPDAKQAQRRSGGRAPDDRAARWRSLSASVVTWWDVRCPALGAPPPLCSARHTPCCLFDIDGKHLHLGRGARLASAAQRMALYARDRGCTRPGCRTNTIHHPPDLSGPDPPRPETGAAVDLLRTGSGRPAFYRLFSVLVIDSTVSSPSLSNSDFKNGPASLASPWNSMSAR